MVITNVKKVPNPVRALDDTNPDALDGCQCIQRQYYRLFGAVRKRRVI